MATWRFVLTELNTTTLAGASLGEVRDAHDRKLALRLNGMGVASFTIKLTNPMAKVITDRDGDVMLKIYQDSTLRFYGDCTSVEEVGTEQGASLACNFASPLWRLSKRLIGKSGPGTTYSASLGWERSSIMENMIQITNASWDTGLRIGSLTPTNVVDAGPWVFKPLSEAFAELAALLMPSYVARQTAYGGTPGSETTTEASHTDEMGNVWANFGDTTVFQPGVYQTTVAPSPISARSAASDTALVPGQPASALGRAAIAGHANSAVVSVGIDYNTQSFSGAQAISHGLIFRYVDSSNFGIAWSQDNVAEVAIAKVVGGTWTNLTTPTVGLPPIASWNSQQVTVSATGTVNFYHYVRGTDIGSPVATATDTVFATGNALDDGKTGYFDGNGGASTDQRFYDNFFALDPAGIPSGVDFELVPSEPTADTNQAGVVGAGVKIATLNTATPLGTSKPNAIFEYGTGGRSVKSYRHVRSREGLLTQAYSLPVDWPTNTASRSYPDDPTFPATVARGLYEEVIPSDVVSADARYGLIIQHVGVRKQARSLLTFEPSSTAPVFGTDYSVGDTVTARAVVNNEVRFNGTVRVYGVDIDLDDEGKETIVPTLVVES